MTNQIPDDRQVSVQQVNAAFEYLSSIVSRPKKRSEFFCIGSGHKTRKFINERLKHRLPAIPLFKNNKELRESAKPREKSPLFRVVAAAIASKTQDLKEQIKAAQNFSPRQDYPVLYRLEPPKDGEESYLPLTWEEYQIMIRDEAAQIS